MFNNDEMNNYYELYNKHINNEQINNEYNNKQNKKQNTLTQHGDITIDWKLNAEKVGKLMNKYRINLFKIIITQLNDNNIPYFLSDGSALGCYRNGKIIPHDVDIDITVSEDRLTDAISILKNNLYKNCDMVCGLYLGRTLIEGFHHNKKGMCYLVDKDGNIEDIKKEYYPEDMKMFKKENIIEEYLELYKSVINKLSITTSGLKSNLKELPYTNFTEGIFCKISQFQLLSSVLILSGLPRSITVTFAP